MKTFYLCFQILCLVATLTLISRCINQYYLDEDNSQLEYRKFHDGEGSIYPSFSICFPVQSAFDFGKMYNITISEPKLWKYLDTMWYCLSKGYFWGKCLELLHNFFGDLFDIVDYENVTINLMKHLLTLEIGLEHQGRVIWSNHNGKMKLSGAFNNIRIGADIVQQNFTKKKVDSIRDPNIYLSYKSYNVYDTNKKCYTVDIPFIKGIMIQSLKLRVRGSLFKKGIQPSKNQFSVRFHYPNQQLMSISKQTSWLSRYNFSRFYEKNIYLDDIHILQRRNKRSQPCHNENYDSYVIDRVTDLVGCTFHVFDNLKNFPFCNKSSQAKASIYEATNQIPPCRSLISAYDWYTESDKPDENMNTSLMDLTIHYPDKIFEEIIYTKEYSFEALVGNIGGYIGKSAFLIFHA